MTVKQIFCGRLARTATASILSLAALMTISGILIADNVKAQNAPEAAAPVASPDLQKRVEQLEEQLVDIQVVIGTLDSLARGGGGGSPVPQTGGAMGAGFNDVGGSADGRIAGLETQIRALTAQLEQLSQQVRALQGASGAATVVTPPSAQVPQGQVPQSVGQTGFGSTTVSPQSGDPIAGYLQQGGTPQSPHLDTAHQPTEVAAIGPAAGTSGNPKELYERAYGFLLQQNYSAAQTAFSDFLQNHPNDSLAGNAQYWLGESFYVRGEYKSAASAFLKGYEKYSKSTKAPDSLLKLAMSLDRLGQRDAACSSYAELANRFPRAPSHVKNRAQSERKRAGC